MRQHKLYFFLFAFLAIASLPSCENSKNGEHADHIDKDQPLYTCPMHPQIIRNAPGSCPICGMDLVKIEKDAGPAAELELDVLLKPANSFVVSTVGVTTITSEAKDVELDVLGKVAYDTRQFGIISSRVSGRIEKLFVRYKFQRVVRGQKVMEVYSPELMTAQQNLLFVLKNDAGNNSLIKAAGDRLLLLGLTNQQVREIISSRVPVYSVPVYSNYSGFVTGWDFNTADPGEGMTSATPGNQELPVREGMYVQKGQSIFSVYNADRIWILLDIFPEQQGQVKIGDPVRIVPEVSPQQSIRAMIDYIEPVFRPGKKTLTARVYLNNASMRLPIGSLVRATIFGKTEVTGWLPREAVLSLGRDRIVFLKEGVGFRARRIIAGKEIDNAVQVLNGISPTDSVAINAQYLIDNESFIKVK